MASLSCTHSRKMTISKISPAQWTAWIAALLIFLFVYTATSKFIQHDNFYARLTLFPWISRFAGILSWVVPLLEIFVSGLLFIQPTRIVGFLCSAILLLGFTVYLFLMLGYHDKLPCTCGGVIEKMTWKQHIFFNLFFILISIIGLFKSGASLDTEKPGHAGSIG